MTAPYPELMDDLQIITSAMLADDKAYLFADKLLVGTKPPSDPVKLAGRDARQMVRRGLSDVLEWLGRPVVTEPVLDAILERRCKR